MPTPLDAARELIEQRLAKLKALGLEDDPLSPSWTEYLATAVALAKVTRATDPAVTGRLMTTKELADKLHVHPKTVLKRRLKVELGLTPVASPKTGKRGAALRWPSA